MKKQDQVLILKLVLVTILFTAAVYLFRSIHNQDIKYAIGLGGFILMVFPVIRKRFVKR